MQDPTSFHVPTAGVNTDIPLLSEEDTLLQCVESSADSNKAGTGLNWNLTFATVNPLTAMDGRPVQPNFKIFHVAGLQPGAETKDPEGYLRQLGDIQDALFNTTKESRADLTPDVIRNAVGQKIIGQLFVDTYQGKKSNKIKRMKPAVGA